MLYKVFFMLAVSATLLPSCSKNLSQSDDSFSVTADKTSINVGDTIQFSFAGNPDMISFYSGETGKRFDYRGRSTADGTPVLRFRSLRANGSQPNSLALMVSASFEGVAVGDTAATISRIASAQWEDITGRAAISSGTRISSGDIDLSDFASATKPVYVAFRYTAETGSVQNKWTIDSFTIKNVLPDGTQYEIANHKGNTTAYTNYGVPAYSPGFVNYRVQNTYNWIISSTSLVITGADSAPWATNTAEAWAIIGPVDLKKVSPDLGTAVKSVSQNIADAQFSYRYMTAGTYEATFQGGRVSIRENDQDIKRITITVN